MRWELEDDITLRHLARAGVGAKECGVILGRSEGAVRARAKRLDVTFDGLACKAVREHLASGAVLVREDVGGGIGVHWACATRSLGGFNAKVCEALMNAGLLVPDERGRTVYRARQTWIDIPQQKEAA